MICKIERLTWDTYEQMKGLCLFSVKLGMAWMHILYRSLIIKLVIFFHMLVFLSG